MSGSSGIKGLFFDLDGTLADTTEALYAAYSEAFGAEGHAFVSKSEATKLFPRRFDTWAANVVPEIDLDKMNRIADHKARYYTKYMHLVRANAPLVEFIKNQRATHCLALVTTAKRVSGERVVEALGLKGVFHEMVFGDDVVQGKPDPEAYLLALQKTGLRPDQVIAFEDSPAGLAAAASARIAAIKVEIPGAL